MGEGVVVVVLPQTDALRNHLAGICLHGLPLCRLLPEGGPVAYRLTETCVATQIAMNLILERVTDFVCNGLPNRMTSAWSNPQCTNLVVVTRTCSCPACIVQQTDNHLILIEFRLDAEVSKLQLIDIQGEERLSLVEQVGHIDIERVRTRQLVGRSLAIACTIINIEVIAAL